MSTSHPAGLTEDEKRCLTALAYAWNIWLTLGGKLPGENEEFMESIHDAQKCVAMLVARRVDPAEWTQPAPAPSPDIGEVPILPTPAVQFADFVALLPLRSRNVLTREGIESWDSLYTTSELFAWRGCGSVAGMHIVMTMARVGAPIPKRWGIGEAAVRRVRAAGGKFFGDY